MFDHRCDRAAVDAALRPLECPYLPCRLAEAAEMFYEDVCADIGGH